MNNRFATGRPRALRAPVVIATALLGVVVPVTGASAASARTALASASIGRAVSRAPSASPLHDFNGPCVHAMLVVVEKPRLLRNAGHLADAVREAACIPPPHRCAALVASLRQTSA